MTHRIVVEDVFEELLTAHLTAMRERNYAEISIRKRRYDARAFFEFARERGITHPREVTLPVLNRYRAHLFSWRSNNPRDKGKPLSFHTQADMLGGVRMFYGWLAKERHILYNPATELEMPKVPQQLPRHILSHEEMEAVIAQPDVALPLGLRDRAILETMYSTAIRRTELTMVAVKDIDFNRGMLRIRFGKYRRERVVPIGERALAWVDKYLQDSRPLLLAATPTDALFLSRRAVGLTSKEMSVIVSKHMRAACPDKPSFGCHIIRHTAATVILEAGADIRHIQEYLGHAHLVSTQVYTRVSPVNLKAVHDRFHPAAKLKKHDGVREEAEP